MIESNPHKIKDTTTVTPITTNVVCVASWRVGQIIFLNSMRDSFKNVLATAHELDVPMPLTAQLFEIQQAIKVAGGMNDDHCGYVKYFERLAGVEVKKLS